MGTQYFRNGAVLDVPPDGMLKNVHVGYNELLDDNARNKFLKTILQHAATITSFELFRLELPPLNVDNVFQHLQRLHNLQELWIQNSHILAAGRARIFAESLPCNLQTLFLNHTGLDDEGAIFIAQRIPYLQKLSSVEIQFDLLGHKAAGSFAECVQTCSWLTELILCCTSPTFGDAGAERIANCIIKSKSLRKLDMTDAHIGFQGAHALAVSIPDSSIVELRLSHNLLGDAGAMAIAEALKCQSTGISHLFLFQCGIGEVGANALAKALDVNQSVVSLELGKNPIGDSGAAAFARPIQHRSKSALVINLDNCSIGNVGITSLAAALEHSPCSRVLTLRCNTGRSEVGFEALKHALVKNKFVDIHLGYGEAYYAQYEILAKLNRRGWRNVFSDGRLPPSLWAHIFARLGKCEESVLLVHLFLRWRPEMLLQASE